MLSLKRPISTLLLISLAMTMPVATSMAAVDEAQARKAGEAAVQTVIPRKIEHKKLKLGFIPFGVKVTDITISENALPNIRSVIGLFLPPPAKLT